MNLESREREFGESGGTLGRLQSDVEDGRLSLYQLKQLLN